MAKVGDINKMTDMEIAEAILNRDPFVTKEFFYKKCYPTFYTFYKENFTNCKSCKEFIDEIYIQILTPSKKTKKCQLENFKGDSTLLTWLRAICLYYCIGQYQKAQRDPLHNAITPETNVNDGEENESVSRNEKIFGTTDIDISDLDREDVDTLLRLMPTQRYSELIRLLYLEGRTHEETANALGMKMNNYYNKRILAVKQFKVVLRKEEEGNG